MTTTQGQAPIDTNTASGAAGDLADTVSKALRRAWQLGQTYWQQADSESFIQNKKSETTHAAFVALLDDTRAALESAAVPAQQPEPSTGHAEADRLICRLMSSDPDFDDCLQAASLIQREIKGPDGYATWREVATVERVARVKAEAALRASRGQAPAQQGVQWQCGPQASGFTAPQADSGAAPAGGTVAGPGWKWVPMVPTDAMSEAGSIAGNGHDWSGPDPVYVAMLAASPTPPAQASDSVLEDAARWQYVGQSDDFAVCRFDDGSWREVFAPDDVIDAARKQGGAA